MRTGKYYCNSSNVIHLIKCNKYDTSNYIGEITIISRLRINNHKKASEKASTSQKLRQTVPLNLCDLECVILKRDISNSTDRLIEEQTLIRKLKTDKHSLTKDLYFLTLYIYFHMRYASPSTHTTLMFDLLLRTVVTLTSLNNIPLLTGTFTSDSPLPPPTLPWHLTYIWQKWPLLLRFTTFIC